MLSALQPSWLLLFFCAILLVLAGCATLSLRTPPPSPTSEPQTTLVAVPFAEVADIHTPLARNFQFTPRVFVNPPPITPAAPPSSVPIGSVEIESPTCYNSPAGQTCLGRIWNKTQDSLRNLSILFESTAEEGLRVGLAQRILPPDGFAPYRLQLEEQMLEAPLAATITAGQANSGQFLLLDVREHSGRLTPEGRFSVQATVQNTTVSAVDQVRVVLTLFDGGGEEAVIVGYRIAEVDESLAPQGQHAISLEIIPFIHLDAPRYELHAEGRPLRRGDTTAAE